jgi:hypothetical protein
MSHRGARIRVMSGWEGALAAGAAIAVAAIGVASTNWSTVHRHAATKQALEIRDLLEGDQRAQWERVIQRHLDAEERRGAGPAQSTVVLLAFLFAYVTWALFQLLSEANRLVAPLAPAMLVLSLGCFVFGLAALVLMGWQGARRLWTERRGRS